MSSRPSPIRAPSWPARGRRRKRCRRPTSSRRALARLLVVAENYPELRSSEIFARLTDELAGTENRIATERMRYNERVQEYNTSRRQFPANITNAIFRFQDYPLFEAPTGGQGGPESGLFPPEVPARTAASNPGGGCRPSNG